MNDFSALKNLFPELIEKSVPDDYRCNFYFVKKYNQELYDKLMFMEGLIKTDLVNCAKNIRDAFTLFMQSAFEKDTEALERARQLSDRELSLNGYLMAAKEFRRLHIDAHQGFKIKDITNRGNHREELGNGKAFNYHEVKEGVVAFHKLLKLYYSLEYPEDAAEIKSKKYSENFQPINDMIVYDTEAVGTGSCEAQFLCYKKNNQSYLYYVVRQYSASRRTTFNRRDEEVLNKLWNESIRNPQGVVKYDRLESRDGSDNPNDKKVFICYQMNGRPMRLSPALMNSWNRDNKMSVILLLSEGITNLHKKNIYHRNLQPGAVYAYRVGKEVGINLVNFEFAKVIGSDATVFNSAVSNYYDDFIFTAPELRHIIKLSDYENIDWEKADIYSLGVLFVYVLLGGSFDTKGSKIQNIQAVLNKYPVEYPSELKKLLLKMCSNIASNRPSAKLVLDEVEKFL